AYVFNYGDDEGYAIVSADKRIDAPILAYCAGGSFSEENLKRDNPAMYYELLDVKNYAVECIARYEERVDSVTDVVLAKMMAGEDPSTRATNYPCPQLRIDEVEPPEGYLPNNFYNFTQTISEEYSITEQVEPLLPVEWHQRYPFNSNVRFKNGSTDAPAGCAPIAIAQLMAYWQYPSYVGILPMNWTLLRNYTARPNAYANVANKDSIPKADPPYSHIDFKSNIAILIEEIGEQVGTVYGDTDPDKGLFGSSTGNEGVFNYLEEIGFDIGNGLQSYSVNAVVNSLINLRPVLVRGDKYVLDDNYGGYYVGHMWLIDGYLERRKLTTLLITSFDCNIGEITRQWQTSTSTYTTYLHHNSGEEGGAINGANAYIVANSFDLLNSNRFTSSTRMDLNFNFQYNKYICTNIHP
ncbi:MAG: C10 family peptidase, partial [Mediterranea sp.]|nr:C10 family peptidase [Mediterranea sp.]